MNVYITTNPRKTVFYTGVTNDLKRRMREHEKNRGNNKTFAGKYYCRKLIYWEEFESPKEAIDREKEIKLLNRSKKLDLIKTKNPKLLFYKM